MGGGQRRDSQLPYQRPTDRPPAHSHPSPLVSLQLSPYVSELALYDIAGTPGVAADVSHINSKAAVKGYAGRCRAVDARLLVPVGA